jgi:hypothetical protein
MEFLIDAHTNYQRPEIRAHDEGTGVGPRHRLETSQQARRAR